MVAHQQAVPTAERDEQVAAERRSWGARPYARTFDLISSAYGWTDEQILNLTMARLRQVRDVIWERQGLDRRAELKVREIELRTTAHFIAAAAGWNDGVRSAAKVTLVPPLPGPDGKTRRRLRPIPLRMATGIGRGR